MKKIALMGAYDRFNYGDLLFPIVLEKYINENVKDVEIDFFGIKESDLSVNGGKITKSYKDLFSKKKQGEYDVIILVGGEMLGATWNEMHLCFIESPLKQTIYKVIRKILGVKFVDSLSKNILASNKNNLLPWVIGRGDKENQKIFYNTVGGSNINKIPTYYKNYIKISINDANYISVRDQKTRENLKSLGVEKEVKLYPDSAIVMSEFFNKDYLLKNISSEVKSIIEKMENNYIIFQINKHLGDKEVDLIANQLRKIYEKKKLKTILLPIGTAALHEDHIPLEKIHKKTKDFTVLVNTKYIYDIMSLISFSNLYIGTSLHGAITALSYGVPHVGATKKVQKLEEFLQTWGIKGYSRCIELSEISENIDSLLEIDPDKLHERSNYLISLSKENLYCIKNEMSL